MIAAYDKIYLAAAQKNLARMLEYLVVDCNYSLHQAWQLFINSNQSFLFEKGDCTTLVGMSGVELAKTILLNAGEDISSLPKASYSYNRTAEYWTGWSVAYYQWITGLRFKEIESAVPIEQIYLLYTPYHEMDIRQFVDKMNDLYRTEKPETNLKTLRILSGITQAELAKISQVPIRTIQQYEQRQKNINKAQAETLLRFARSLNCNIEDIMEKII